MLEHPLHLEVEHIRALQKKIENTQVEITRNQERMKNLMGDLAFALGTSVKHMKTPPERVAFFRVVSLCSLPS